MKKNDQKKLKTIINKQVVEKPECNDQVVLVLLQTGAVIESLMIVEKEEIIF